MKTPEELTAFVIGRIKRVRLRRGWTQSVLADRLTICGLPTKNKTVCILESGRRVDLTVAELVYYAKAFDVCVAYLLGDTNRMDTTDGGS